MANRFLTSDCYCSNFILATATRDLMGFCNVECLGDDGVACGGDNVPVVYTTNSDGSAYEDYFATYPDGLMPEYSCEALGESPILTRRETSDPG